MFRPSHSVGGLQQQASRNGIILSQRYRNEAKDEVEGWEEVVEMPT